MHTKFFRRSSFVTVFVLTGALTAALVAPQAFARTDPINSTPPSTGSDAGFADAYYFNKAAVPQAKSPGGMLRYLSNDQPQMEMQSYVFFGNLITRGGKFNSFASMVQRQDGLIPQIPNLPVTISTTIFNSGQGWFGGMIDGVPEVVDSELSFYPMSLTTNPWSARSEEFTPGQKPQFIDLRVVNGQLGQPGAVYEITSSITSDQVSGGAQGEPMTVYVRVKDVLGIAMWGFGPSGFKPQWLSVKQRAEIKSQYGGSIKRYLRATDDPMTGQGNYYYSSPLLKVQKFAVYRNGKQVLSGNSGYTFFDLCTQSFGPAARQVLDEDFGWVSFEIPIPGVNGGMALGRLSQPTVGSLSYAALATDKSPRAQNGARIAYNWGIEDISLKPVANSAWKSPASGKTYYMKWNARLSGSSSARRGRLTLTAVNRNSEINVSGRSVYEGLFRYSGVIGGKKVSGSAFAEMQPEGTLGSTG